MNTKINGTTAAKVSNERAQQYDEVTKVIRIGFEHDGRMEAEEARDYVAARVLGYATAHAHTIEEGTHILDVEDMGEPEPENAPTFEDTARETFAEAYDQGINPDTLAKAIGDQISRTVVEAYGKGEDAAYLLNAIAYYVQSYRNPAL